MLGAEAFQGKSKFRKCNSLCGLGALTIEDRRAKIQYFVRAESIFVDSWMFASVAPRFDLSERFVDDAFVVFLGEIPLDDLRRDHD